MGKKSGKGQPSVGAGGAKTSTITPSSTSTNSSEFAPLPYNYYAHLLAAPDAHTVRIYDSKSAKCVVRWATSGSEPGVKSLTWALKRPAVPAVAVADEEVEPQGKRGKKRRKSSASNGGDGATEERPTVMQDAELVLALGLENGSIVLLSPASSSSSTTPSTTLTDSTTTSPVTSLSAPSSTSISHLWSAHEDGSLRIWDLTTCSLLAKVNIPSVKGSWDSIDVRYKPSSSSSDEKLTAQLVLVRAKLWVGEVKVNLKKLSAKKEKDGVLVTKELLASLIGACAGHVGAAEVRFLPSFGAEPEEGLRIVSWSSEERVAQFWNVEEGGKEGKLEARLSLEDGVSKVDFVQIKDVEGITVAALATSGKTSLATLDSTTATSATGKSTVASVKILSEVVGGAGVAGLRILESGKDLLVCRGNVKPAFEVVNVQNEDGAWSELVQLTAVTNGLLNGVDAASGSAPLPTRYVEPLSSTVATSASKSAPTERGEEDDDEGENDGVLDVDRADLTLAQRLKALEVGAASKKKKGKSAAAIQEDDEEDSASDDEEDEVEDEGSDEESEEEDDVVSKIPRTTLASSLIQGLHSSDAPLLESCFAHGDSELIRSTVKRVPSGGLVLTLLETLVERLAREGAKGRRGKSLVEWIRQTLLVHVGFLVTVPSLVTRLASLHSTLSTRLALQPTLLALNGRLELVVSQIDMGRERVKRRNVAAEGSKIVAKKYVEGDSDSEGSVEDIVLGSEGEDGGDSDSEGEDDLDLDEEEDEDFDSGLEEDSDEDDSETEGAGAKQFLSLEASESGSDDEDEENEEDSD